MWGWEARVESGGSAEPIAAASPRGKCSLRPSHSGVRGVRPSGTRGGAVPARLTQLQSPEWLNPCACPPAPAGGPGSITRRSVGAGMQCWPSPASP